jgi:hypothetical protein
VIAPVACAALWLALNVARYYAYDGETGQSHLFSVIVRAQDVLTWVIVALLAAIAIWTLLSFVVRLKSEWVRRGVMP